MERTIPSPSVTIAKAAPQDFRGASAVCKVSVYSGDDALRLKRFTGRDAGQESRPAVAVSTRVSDDSTDCRHLEVVDLAGFGSFERPCQQLLREVRVVRVAVAQQSGPELRGPVETRSVGERASGVDGDARVHRPPSANRVEVLERQS